VEGMALRQVAMRQWNLFAAAQTKEQHCATKFKFEFSNGDYT